MATSIWTNGDLAALTTQAMDMLNDEDYCQHCLVVPIPDGDKYCAQCANELVEALALRFHEQSLSDNGWY